MKTSFGRSAITISCATLLLGMSVFVGSTALADGSNAKVVVEKCPSGKMTVRLTGWSVNGKTPRGEAIFDETSKMLKVTVKSVGLDDGTTLNIFLDDEKVGETAELKSGEIVAAFTVSSIPEAKDVLKVSDDDRPIVTGSMACSESSNTNAE